MIGFLDVVDVPEVVKDLQEFSAHSPVHTDVSGCRVIRHAHQVIHRILSTGGVGIKYSHQGEISGWLLAARVPDLWIPDQWHLREIAWWVRPDQRGGRVAWHLLKAYQELGDTWLRRDIVHSVGLTTLTDSPIRDLSRWGFTQVETNWIMENK